MTFCYSSTPAPFTGNVDVSRMNGTKAYLGHYSNYLYLSFIHANGDRLEKQQAALELEICERKMKYWRHHQNFNQDEANTGAVKLKRDWAN